MVNLLNPPIVTFYLVVVPSFVPAGASGWYFVALAAIHVAMAFCCHSAWAVAFHRVRDLVTRPRSRRILEGATGLALLGLAVRVLW
jgi:threonine/homoserine/homoserine lactone efflux protein